MNTLHRYLLRQVIASLVMTMMVFTFVLLIGNVLHEILPLLVNGQASFVAVAEALGLLIPFVFAFALPMAMLTSTLLVFGRFSADQELTAARASGVSLLSLAMPVLILGLLLCGVSAVINMQIAPECRVAYNGLRTDMRTALANFKLPEAEYLEFPSKTNDTTQTIYTRRNRNGILQDVWVYKVEHTTNTTVMHALTGRLVLDTNAQMMILELTNVSILGPDGHSVGGDELPVALDLKTEKKDIGISDMTFSQLRVELRRHRITPPAPLKPESNGEAARKKGQAQNVWTDFTEPIRIQMHRQVSFSFACFGFTLIGIPLGIRMHRRETNIGVAVALGLVAIYYTFLVVGQSLSAHAEYAPHLLMWAPNFVFEAVGAVLLWRANRGI